MELAALIYAYNLLIFAMLIKAWSEK
jgi:hypothetical protein